MNHAFYISDTDGKEIFAVANATDAQQTLPVERGDLVYKRLAFALSKLISKETLAILQECGLEVRVFGKKLQP